MAPTLNNSIDKKREGSTLRSRITKNSCDSEHGKKLPEQVERRNERERRRVRQVNLGFVHLGEHVPKWRTKNKKLSKVETLREAARYIQYLETLLKSNDLSSTKDLQQCLDENSFTYSSSSSVSSDNEYIVPSSSGNVNVQQTTFINYYDQTASNNVSPTYTSSTPSPYYGSYNIPGGQQQSSSNNGISNMYQTYIQQNTQSYY
uniref:BHLH domain-containing protein n=1 Tax=Parastrongyloides trichosuri TaxID=131310 RepID=A0A0N4Z5V6_PARTI